MENNDLIDEMNERPDGEAMKAIRTSYDTAQKVTAEMKSIQKESADVKDATFKLKRKLAGLEPDWDAKLSFAVENGEWVKLLREQSTDSVPVPVTKTLSSIRSANSILDNLEIISEKNNEKMRKWNETVSLQLKALKDKIAQAKHAAEGVRIHQTFCPQAADSNVFPLSDPDFRAVEQEQLQLHPIVHAADVRPH